MANPLLRQLPRVDDVLRHGALEQPLEQLPRELVLDGVRAELDARRQALLSGSDDVGLVDTGGVAEAAASRVARRLTPRLREVINATGVVLHTNLGRAPLAADLLAEAAEVARGYSNLEYDLDARRRGSRYVHSAQLLQELTGAEDSLVVNNNAAAMVLMLAGVARDREVVVSRGELIEIGGSFRLPEIFEQGGAHLVEVGATNRTHRRDYERAITENTAMLLKVHRSNFDIVGFTSEVSGNELADLAHERGIVAAEDLGSGCLVDLQEYGIDYVTVADRVAAGLDLVTFSGDKMLGGPQAGVIVGRASLVSRLRKHPLTRAFRVDKLTLAMLERTLLTYVDGSWRERLPTLRMLTTPLSVLQTRAERVAERLTALGLSPQLVPSDGRVGGGALPGLGLPGVAVSLSLPGRATAVDARLREGTPPVVCRLVDDALIFDVRTIDDAVTDDLITAIDTALARGVNSV